MIWWTWHCRYVNRTLLIHRNFRSMFHFFLEKYFLNDGENIYTTPLSFSFSSYYTLDCKFLYLSLWHRGWTWKIYTHSFSVCFLSNFLQTTRKDYSRISMFYRATKCIHNIEISTSCYGNLSNSKLIETIELCETYCIRLTLVIYATPKWRHDGDE